MSLNELVDMYNQKLNSNGGRSTVATDQSHYTPQSTFTMNTGFDSIPETTNNPNFTFTQSASSALLFDADTSRFSIK